MQPSSSTTNTTPIKGHPFFPVVNQLILLSRLWPSLDNAQKAMLRGFNEKCNPRIDDEILTSISNWILTTNNHERQAILFEIISEIDRQLAPKEVKSIETKSSSEVPTILNVTCEHIQNWYDKRTTTCKTPALYVETAKGHEGKKTCQKHHLRYQKDDEREKMIAEKKARLEQNNNPPRAAPVQEAQPIPAIPIPSQSSPSDQPLACRSSALHTSDLPCSRPVAATSSGSICNHHLNKKSQSTDRSDLPNGIVFVSLSCTTQQDDAVGPNVQPTTPPSIPVVTVSDMKCGVSCHHGKLCGRKAVHLSANQKVPLCDKHFQQYTKNQEVKRQKEEQVLLTLRENIKQQEAAVRKEKYDQEMGKKQKDDEKKEEQRQEPEKKEERVMRCLARMPAGSACNVPGVMKFFKGIPVCDWHFMRAQLGDRLIDDKAVAEKKDQHSPSVSLKDSDVVPHPGTQLPARFDPTDKSGRCQVMTANEVTSSPVQCANYASHEFAGTKICEKHHRFITWVSIVEGASAKRESMEGEKAQQKEKEDVEREKEDQKGAKEDAPKDSSDLSVAGFKLYSDMRRRRRLASGMLAYGSEVDKMLTAEWKKMSESQKKHYEDQAAKDMGGEKKAKEDQKTAKEDSDRFASAYKFFFDKRRNELKKERPGLTNSAISKEIAGEWTGMSESQKKYYEDQVAKDHRSPEKDKERRDQCGALIDGPEDKAPRRCENPISQVFPFSGICDQHRELLIEDGVIASVSIQLDKKSTEKLGECQAVCRCHGKRICKVDAVGTSSSGIQLCRGHLNSRADSK